MNKSHIADAARVIEWANENPRRPAHIAFTDGAERQAAYWIEWAENRLKNQYILEKNIKK